MESRPVSSVELSIKFLDPGNALKFSAFSAQAEGAAYRYLQDNHSELWYDPNAQIMITFSQNSRNKINIRVSLVCDNMDVSIDFEMGSSARSPRCIIAVVDRNSKVTVRYSAVIESDGRLVKIGLAQPK